MAGLGGRAAGAWRKGRQAVRKIAIYGKGGIGKSTVAQNLAAVLAGDLGRDVLLIGCDPKADSTRLLRGGMARHTVLDVMRAHDEDDIELSMLVERGFAGVRCVESGGPEPGVGCAGRGIVAAIEQLEQLGAYSAGTDYVLYDVLGDVVCGGFAMPIRDGKAQEVYIVASGEFMSLYAANNICKGIARYANAGGARLAGVICNCRNVDNEVELVAAFAQGVGSQLVHAIPRDNVVQRAEIARQTLVEFDPACPQAGQYRALAAAVEERPALAVPAPMGFEQLEQLVARYSG